MPGIGGKKKGKMHKTKAQLAVDAEAMKAAAEASTSSLKARALTASTSASKAPKTTKTKKKDAKAEDPHRKKSAGRKPPPAASKRPSTTDKPMRQSRRKKKAELPLLFQRMPKLMNHTDDPSSVDSLVHHLSSWNPLKGNDAAMKDPPDGGGKPSAETTNSESEGRVDDEAIGDATTKPVELEESMAVEAIAATDDASMETSSSEAPPTTVDSFTQTEPVKVPRLASRILKIKSEDMIALDELAFTFTKNKNMQIRRGQNIHGPDGAATRAKNRSARQLVDEVMRNDLTPEQQASVLRDASVHKDARLHFKSAGLIDPDEFETLKFMMSQADKFLEKVLKTESAKGRVANERKEMVNSFFTMTAEDDATAPSGVSVPSKRRRLDVLKSIPKATGHRIMNKMQAKRSVLMLGSPSKEQWQTITSKKGKGLKVSEEDRAKIVEWVKAHPDVVASPIRRDTVLCKAPTPEDPDRKVKRNKLLRTVSVRVLHNDLYKPEIGLPDIVLKNGVKQLSDTVPSES